MSTTTVAYPFDPTGTAISNRITGERQTLTPGDWKDFFTLMPKAAPFFGESLVVIHHQSGRTLVDGVDYSLGHRFHDASLACGKAIYGSFALYDRNLTGVVELAYQTIGGNWTLDEITIQDILANKLANPVITTWEQIVDLPARFPVINHEWDLVDLVGGTEVVEALNEIADTIANRQAGGLEEHKADFLNPHQVTKTQVGLGLVQNYEIANTTEAEQGLVDNRYMTPLKTAQAIQYRAVAPFEVHRDARNNPHQVTKEQVSLGLVQNYGLASDSEAVAGVLDTRYMTPLKTQRAIQQQALVPLGEHTSNYANPHQVTAAQVGLGNVQNLPLADVVIAQQGTSNAHYMTPSTTRAMINTVVGEDFSNHTNNTNNPHSVTKEQIGLGLVENFPVATEVQAVAGTANNVYMTPLRTQQLIETAIDQSIDAHANDVDNPHLVTKTQVGLSNVQNFPVASQSQAEDGSLDNVYMTPLKTKQYVDTRVSGVSGDLDDHTARIDNPHQVTAAQVGSYTEAEVNALVDLRLLKTATAENSLKLEGYSFADVVAAAGSGGLKSYPALTQAGLGWQKILSATVPADDTKPNIYFKVAGQSSVDEEPTVAFIAFHTTSTGAKVYFLEGDFGSLEMGYVVDAGVTHFYVKSFGHRSGLGVQLIYAEGGYTYPTDPLLTAEPANYTAFREVEVNVSEVEFAEAGHVGQVIRGVRGGFEPQNRIAHINMVDGADLTTAQALNHYQWDWLDESQQISFFHRSHPLKSSGSPTALSNWTESLNGPTFIDYVGPATAVDGIYSSEALLDYTVEATITSSADHQGGVGFCAAMVEVAGKYYTLDVVRQPGNMSGVGEPTGNQYELLTVNLNLYRNDALDLGSTSAGLKWGDGVLDEDRATAGAYVAAGNGWATLGDIPIRIVRSGNTLSIYTANTGEALPGTPNVVVALDSPELAALFAGRPSRWGIITTPTAAGVSVELTKYPGQYQTVMVRSPAAHADYQKLQRYNGAAWSVYAPSTHGLNGRDVYSPIDGTMWRFTARGTPKPIFIAAQASSSQTVLTT